MEITYLDPEQMQTRDLFVSMLGLTQQEATALVAEIGPARSEELGALLRTCTGTIAETLAVLFCWQPRPVH